MGNRNKSVEKIEEVDRNMFDFISVIGKGGFGKVWKVRYKKKLSRICNERNVKSYSY